MGLRNYKKIVITSVVAGVMGFAMNAQATIDLDNDSQPSTKFASELAISASGTSLTNVTNDLSWTVEVGNSITSSGQAIYGRFDLDNGATFVATPTVRVNDSSGDGQGIATLQDNYAGKSYIIFGLAPSNDTGITIRTNDSVHVVPGQIKVINESSVSISYGLYEGLAAATNKTSTALVASEAGTLLSFTPGHTVTGAAVAYAGGTNNGMDYIDVTQGSTYWGLLAGSTGQDVINPIGLMTITDNTARGQLAVAGNYSAAGGTYQSAATLVVTGSFAAADTTSDGVFMDTTSVACAASAKAADTLTTTTAQFDYAPLAATIANGWICYEVDGTTIITPSAYTAVFTPTNTATTWDASATTVSLGSTSKNGSTAYVNLGLTPGGAYSNYIRISNPSSVDGDVYLVVYTDDGTASSQFGLSAISGVSSDELVAGASTSLLSVSSIFTASGLSTTTGKLRIEATGEFSGIAAQSIILSKDGNSFATTSDY